MKKITIVYAILLIIIFASISACTNQSFTYRPITATGLYYKIDRSNSRMGVVSFNNENEGHIIIPCEYDTIYYFGNNTAGIFIAETDTIHYLDMVFDFNPHDHETQFIETIFTDLRITPEDFDSSTLLGNNLFRATTNRGNYYFYFKSDSNNKLLCYYFGPCENLVEGKTGYFAKVNGKWGFDIINDDCNKYPYSTPFLDAEADSIIQIYYSDSDNIDWLFHKESGWEAVNIDGSYLKPHQEIVNYILSEYNIDKPVIVIEL